MTTCLRRVAVSGVFAMAVLFSSSAIASVEVQGQPCELPLEGTYTVTDGPNEGFHHSGSEEAIDLATGQSTPPVYPCKGGKVIFAGVDNSGFGNLVKVEHDDGTVSYYAHLKTIHVRRGQSVGYTTKLGEVDSTGKSTGNHLHFEVRDAEGEAVSVRYLVDWNDGCPAEPGRDTCAGGAGTATGPSRSATVLIETLYFDTYQISVSSEAILGEGQRYTVAVQGTLSYWAPSMWGAWTGDTATNVCEGKPEREPLYPSPGRANGPTSHDPEYEFAYPKYTYRGEYSCPPGADKLGRHFALRMSVDGGKTFEHVEPEDSVFNPDHSYRYVVRGGGHPLVIMLLDSYYPDNNGMLKIEIRG